MFDRSYQNGGKILNIEKPPRGYDYSQNNGGFFKINDGMN